MSLKPPVLLDENNNKKENRITAKAWHKNPGSSTQGCFQHVIKGHNFTELETKKYTNTHLCLFQSVEA